MQRTVPSRQQLGWMQSYILVICCERQSIILLNADLRDYSISRWNSFIFKHHLTQSLLIQAYLFMTAWSCLQPHKSRKKRDTERVHTIPMLAFTPYIHWLANCDRTPSDVFKSPCKFRGQWEEKHHGECCHCSVVLYILLFFCHKQNTSYHSYHLTEWLCIKLKTPRGHSTHTNSFFYFLRRI